jgi:hypothetical protein
METVIIRQIKKDLLRRSITCDVSHFFIVMPDL